MAKKKTNAPVMNKKITLQGIYSMLENRTTQDLMSLEENVTVLVARVYGEAFRFRPKTGQYGEYFEIIGKFRGISPEGEIMEAPKILLPDFVADEIVTAMQENEGAIQFAYDFFAKGRPDLPRKYEWLAESLIDQSDPFTALEESIGIDLPKQITAD